ncbi:hypothetical protein H4582DRAFT_2061308 [Lactarius indigo]|nr:hypothetical protein H4582DRAFT_2061308 [Lactarius indigo]
MPLYSPIRCSTFLLVSTLLMANVSWYLVQEGIQIYTDEADSRHMNPDPYLFRHKHSSFKSVLQSFVVIGDNICNNKFISTVHWQVAKKWREGLPECGSFPHCAVFEIGYLRITHRQLKEVRVRGHVPVPSPGSYFTFIMSNGAIGTRYWPLGLFEGMETRAQRADDADMSYYDKFYS